MPIDDAALAAALDKGIADAAPSAPVASTAPAGGNDDADTTGTEGTDEGADGVQSDAGAIEQGDAGGVAVAEGVVPNDATAVPTGTAPATTGPDGKPVAPTGTQPEGAPVAKEPDPLNDPLPNALKPETKKRIHTLIDMVKTTSTERDTLRSNVDTLMNPILESGATPAQYKQSLDYLRLVNSPSRADKEKALEIMQGEIRALATMIGKPVPGVNFLEGHDDLIQAVGQGQLTHAHAMEIAAARAAQGYSRKAEERVALERQSGEEQARAVQEGRAALNALESSLRADPHYMAKKSILVNTLRPVFSQIHPSQWAATFHKAYRELPAPAAPAQAAALSASKPVAPSGGGGNAPLRASNPAGAQRPAPTSLEEAINFGIRDAGR